MSYESSAGNGIAGWGWNIGGLSSITRVPRNNYYYDAAKVEENYHYYQQKQMGFARFYGKTLTEYGKGFFQGDWQKAYTTPGTLEYDAARVVRYYKNYKSSIK